MRIVHIEEAFHPQYGYQVQNFCRHHSKAHEIHVVTGATLRSKFVTETPEDLKRLDAAFTERNGTIIHRLPVAFQLKHKTWLGGLRQTLDKINPDVVFCHGVEYVSFSRVMGWKLDERCLVVTDSHDLPTADANPYLRWLYRFLVQDRAVRRLNKRGLLCFRTALGTEKRLDGYKIRRELQPYLPIGTCMKTFYRDEEGRREVREELGATDSDVVLLYTGKHDYEKRPHVFYEAAQHLSPPVGGKLILHSVGARQEEYFAKEAQPVLDKLEAQGVKVVLRKAVPFTELKRHYSAADVGVFPCFNTLSTLDALACALPVVMQEDATNCDRLNQGGLVYPGGNVPALAKTVQGLIDDPERRSALGYAGAADVKARFDYAGIVARLEEQMQVELDKLRAMA
jgi:glycosyltransferase involved in cell wall biosynthesis